MNSHPENVIVPVREQIYNRIKNMLISNEYQPGDFIQIDKIARQFSVSATPIREAFIRLESAGFLKLIPNKGARVVEIHDVDIKETWEMRKILEPYAGRLTARLGLKKEIARLKIDIEAIIEGDYDQESYIKADNDVHALIFNQIDNSLLKETIEKIHERSMRMRYHAENSAQNNEKIVRQVCQEHLKILNALNSGDPDKAEATIRTHIVNGEQRTLSASHNV
jgi:DNA-binding GntR family transcriptional regulator